MPQGARCLLAGHLRLAEARDGAQLHLSGEGPGGAGDYGDPAAASKLDWVWVIVDVDVREHANHLLNHRGVRFPSFDWLC